MGCKRHGHEHEHEHERMIRPKRRETQKGRKGERFPAGTVASEDETVHVPNNTLCLTIETLIG